MSTRQLSNDLLGYSFNIVMLTSLFHRAKLPLFISLFFFFPAIAQASIILSEIQVSGDKVADEFVELYNTDDEPVSLKDYSLRRKSQGDVTAKGSSLKTFGSSDTIPAHGYFLWASSAGIFKEHADTTTSGGLADNNSLGLFDTDGDLIEALTWGAGHTLPFSATQFENPEKKESFTRDVDTLNWTKTKEISPTNSKGEVWEEDIPPPPEPKPLKQVVINEVFPNPKEKGDLGEFIELYNPLSETVDLSQWEIRDATASGKYVFPSGKKIEANGYLVITDQDFTLSLNNSKETLTLLDGEKRLVHSVSYDKTREGVTLNLVGEKLKGGKAPTPGKENSFNTDPVTKERVPKHGYRDILVEFRAKGEDSDGDSLKYTWDFGDDHKSYKRETKHTYKETGKYTVTLTTDDGTDTTEETFTIEIKKYEAPKLRIVALMPNPEGNDSDLEWIEIENREKKSVNLQGFGIATGSKKKSITNHPIKDSLEIKGKSVRRLTRDDALFSLHNTKGYVELRAPTGEVVHDLKYKFEKSLDDNVVLRKEKGKGISVVTSPEAESEPTDVSEETILNETSAQAPVTEVSNTSSTIEPAVQGASTEDLAPPTVPQPIETVPKNTFFEYLRSFLGKLFDESLFGS